MLSHFSHVQLFATPQTVTHQASLSMGFSRQEYWSRLPFPLPRDLPNSGIKPTFHAAPALKADSLTLSHQRSPALSIYGYKYCKCNMYITYYKCNMHIIYIHTHTIYGLKFDHLFHHVVILYRTLVKNKNKV